MKKKYLAVVIVAMLTFSSVVACSSDKNDSGEVETTTSFIESMLDEKPEENGFPNDMNSNGNAEESIGNVNTEKFDIDINYSDKEKLSVTEEQINSYSNIIKLEGESVTISKSGEYVIEGTLKEGQVIVDVADTDTDVVTLILNGVDITCSNSAAIYVKSADKVVISLVKGTENNLVDGSEYSYDDVEEEEPNACVYSKDDLVISGEGTLNVKANFNNGIASKDDLTITGGTINIEAVNNGIKGKDSIAVMDGNITVKAGGDAFKSDNATDEGKGFIIIDGGNFDVTSGEDAFQAETCMEINDGTFNITTGEGATSTSWGNSNDWGRPGFGMDWESSSSSTDSISIKAFKAGCDITINAGQFTINSEDDAIHSNISMEIDGGSFDIKSGDDGLHADDTLIINNGNISVTQCYEGIEATHIIMNDGEVRVISSDDGFNAAGGNDSSAMGGRPGMNGFSGGTGSLTINGGYAYINANGDGLDANGTFDMSNGVVIVDGPTNSGNGAFDYGSGCSVTGGFLLAVGASGMAQMPNEATINCVMITLNQTISTGSLLNISDSDGNSILTYDGAKSYNNVVLCTSLLETGETYTVSTGGNVSGTDTDGIYTGEYSNGTELTTFTVESTLTGNSGGMQRPGGGMQMPGGGFGGGRR